MHVMNYAIAKLSFFDMENKWNNHTLCISMKLKENRINAQAKNLLWGYQSSQFVEEPCPLTLLDFTRHKKVTWGDHSDSSAWKVFVHTVGVLPIISWCFTIFSYIWWGVVLNSYIHTQSSHKQTLLPMKHHAKDNKQNFFTKFCSPLP